MFAVVQFIENKKFQVLAVPVSWIKSGFLMWPKMSNEKIEKLRVSGEEFHGPTKRISIIIWKKLRNFQAAENAAVELAMKEVSDVDGKKKMLKPQKKPKLANPKDYNAMCEAIQQQKPAKHRPQKQQYLGNLALTEKTDNQQQDNLNDRQHPGIHTQVLASETSQATPTRPTSIPHEKQLSQPIQPQPRILERQNANPQMKQPLASHIIQPESNISVLNGAASNTMISSQSNAANNLFTETPPVPLMQQELEPVYCTDGEIYYVTNTGTDQENLNNYGVTGNSGVINYVELKKDLEHFIKTTVEATVEKCFQDHFAKLATLMEMQAKSSRTVPEGTDGSVEQHNRISNEVELHNWNVKLGNEELGSGYLEYFARIIPPNSYTGNGDNACYTIVDCLFTREFWTRFTWTGISRGHKSKRGFREFGNVLQHLLKLVRIGDPTYCSQKLETSCRTRLFRYSKSRCSNKQLRKSAYCPARKLNKTNKATQNDQSSNAFNREDEYPDDQSDATEIECAEEKAEHDDVVMYHEENEADNEHDEVDDSFDEENMDSSENLSD